MDKRNIGRFDVPIKLVDDHPNLIARIFAKLKVVPVRVEAMYLENVIEYVALSKFFPTRTLGELIPDYKLNIQQRRSGSVFVTMVCLTDNITYFEASFSSDHKPQTL